MTKLYTVNTLAWGQYPNQQKWVATTPFGSYYIRFYETYKERPFSLEYYFAEHDDGSEGYYGTLEDAQQAAYNCYVAKLIGEPECSGALAEAPATTQHSVRSLVWTVDRTGNSYLAMTDEFTYRVKPVHDTYSFYLDNELVAHDLTVAEAKGCAQQHWNRFVTAFCNKYVDQAAVATPPIHATLNDVAALNLQTDIETT